MKKFYFTFGKIHCLESGESLGGNYVVIEAESEKDAVRRMTEARGAHWSHVYPNPRAAGVEQFELTEVELDLVKLNFK